MISTTLKDKTNFYFKENIARYITAFYGPDKWYQASCRLVSFLMLFKKRSDVIKTGVSKQRSYRLDCAYLLNSILSLLTRAKKPFNIPIKAKGIDIFNKSRPGGILLCSLHIPLSKVALRYLLEHGIKLDVAIAADYHKIPSVAVWGITDVIPAIGTGPSVLIKAKSILSKGGTVVALVDRDLGLSISPNLFLLAHKLKAQVVYFLSELMPDGTISVSFLESAVLGPDAQTTVELQIGELKEHVQDIISRYDKYRYNKTPAPSQKCPEEAGVSLAIDL